MWKKLKVLFCITVKAVESYAFQNVKHIKSEKSGGHFFQPPLLWHIKLNFVPQMGFKKQLIFKYYLCFIQSINVSDVCLRTFGNKQRWKDQGT